jgi:hypothetical protein
MTYGAADSVHQPPGLLVRVVQGREESGQDHGNVGKDEDSGSHQGETGEQSKV